jgi:hypothetical protein
MASNEFDQKAGRINEFCIEYSWDESMPTAVLLTARIFRFLELRTPVAGHAIRGSLRKRRPPRQPLFEAAGVRACDARVAGESVTAL